MQKPIGIFDSGIGGTSIWKEIQKLLPNESTIYLADSKNAPYGAKSKEAIIDLSIKNVNILLRKNCKLIVVACNTATTNSISFLRSNFDVPFIGIEPAIKPAALKTTTNNIGILATKGTLSSSLFSKTSQTFASNIQVVEQIGTGIVELIETGKLHSKEMTALLITYLNPMLKANIDHLVLGCTHYPYLIPQIKDIVGPKVTIIDSGYAVAKQTKSILELNNLLNSNTLEGSHIFYTNNNKAVLNNLLATETSNYTVKSKDF
ncbi:glutamate racemase [Urechidicola sp. KH5]